MGLRAGRPAERVPRCPTGPRPPGTRPRPHAARPALPRPLSDTAQGMGSRRARAAGDPPRSRWRAPLRDQGPVVAVVALGGVAGAFARYGAGLLHATAAVTFPRTTFLVNAAGCAAIGVLMAVVAERLPSPHRLVRPFLGTGVLGGFTTLSTYPVDVQRLLTAGRVAVALLYLAATPRTAPPPCRPALRVVRGGADPPSVEDVMMLTGPALRLTVHVGEHDTWHHRPLHSEIVRRAHAPADDRRRGQRRAGEGPPAAVAGGADHGSGHGRGGGGRARHPRG